MTEPNRIRHAVPGRPDFRRTPQGPRERLVLTPMLPSAVFDRGHGSLPEGVRSSGRVRETCPHCRAHLQLVLRQEAVRLAHLFCDRCVACFNAHYPDGRCALTI